MPALHPDAEDEPPPRRDPTKPLYSKLLAVPALRQKCRAYVRGIAEKWLDWNTLLPIAKALYALIAADVTADTRKLYDNAGFAAGIADTGHPLKIRSR